MTSSRRMIINYWGRFTHTWLPPDSAEESVSNLKLKERWELGPVFNICVLPAIQWSKQQKLVRQEPWNLQKKRSLPISCNLLKFERDGQISPHCKISIHLVPSYNYFQLHQNVWKNRLTKTGRRKEPKIHEATSLLKLKIKRDYAKECHELTLPPTFPCRRCSFYYPQFHPPKRLPPAISFNNASAHPVCQPLSWC